MIKTIRTNICIFVSVIFSSCVSSQLSHDQNYASIRGAHQREKLLTTKWSTFTVESVDGVQQVGLLNHRAIKLSPGFHTISVGAKFTLPSTIVGPYAANADIRMKFEAAKQYELDGSVEGKKIRLWINDMSNKTRVSEGVLVDYRFDPQMPYVYVPAN